jgi:polysaccharide biosynthesis transport protein
MRLAFWRTGNDKARVQRASKPAPATFKSTGARLPGDLDLRALGHALVRNKGWITVPTVLAAVLSTAAVNLVTPRYQSEARILINGRQNALPRPNSERNEERTALDAEAVTSQVQRLLSRDLAREIIKKNKLAERPEFDPVLQGVSPLKSLLAMLGRAAVIHSRRRRKNACWMPISTVSPPTRSINRPSS